MNTLIIAFKTISAGTLDLNCNQETLGSLSDGGSSSGTITNTATSNARLIINQSQNATFAGQITGATLGLTKTGTGTLTLTGTNSYGGSTLVSQGTLKINGALDGSNVTVSTDTAGQTATLAGGVGASNGGTLHASTHTYDASTSVGVIGGTLTVGGNTEGHLAPGNSVGTIGVNSLVLQSNAVLDYELNAIANDLTVVTATDGLTIHGGGFNLYQEGTTDAWQQTGVFYLIAYTGAIGGEGLSTLSVLNGDTSQYTYAFGTDTVDGSDYVTLSITTVPEPSWVGALGAGAFGLLLIRRRA